MIEAREADEATAQARHWREASIRENERAMEYLNSASEAQAHAEDLRAALEEIGQDCDNPSEAKIFDPESGETSVVWVIEADRLRGKLLDVLARTPAQSMGLMKAEALRLVASTIKLHADNLTGDGDYYSGMETGYMSAHDTLIEEADRLDKEATNGTD
jgi:hypothetical protein